MESSQVKAVLFDFGQTLVDSSNGFRAAEKEAEGRIFRDIGGESWERFLSGYRRVREELQIEGNFSRKSMWQDVYVRHDHKPDLQLLQKWERDYWKRVRAKTTLFPETNRILGNLVSQYQVGLITNTEDHTVSGKHRISGFPKLERFFQVVIVAGESGVPPKPDSAPFLLCLEKLGRVPHEAIYIGDDWRIDICGAQNAGIQPVWLKHRSVHRRWPSVETSVPVITNLEQLLDMESILS